MVALVEGEASLVVDEDRAHFLGLLEGRECWAVDAAVHREVKEEVGIDIADVSYWGSQPWPFPHSLMVGFTARYRSGELALDPHEILDARWCSPDDLPPIPPRLSIARLMIDDWI